MFLEPYKLKQVPYTSSGSRNLTIFFTNFNLQNKLKALSLSKKWNSGRNISGRVVIRTKTSLLRKNKTIKINYNLRHLRLGFLISFVFVPFRNKLLSLIYYSNGAFSYFLTGESHKLFIFVYFQNIQKFKKVKFKNFFFMLFQIQKLSFVSLIELIPGKNAQYSRSSGTKSRIIKFDYDNHSVLLKLPSGVKKIFSYYSYAMLDRVALSNNVNFYNGKAGYWRSFGIKSLVRGVAMNPVDHPHGGRTKAVKYPRTPWGKTTKFK